MLKNNKMREGSPILLFFVTGVLILGIFSGVIAAKISKEASEITLAELFDAPTKRVFFHSFSRQALWCCLVALGTISPFLIPVALIALFAKSFFYGYAAGFLVRVFSLHGLFVLYGAVFFQNFLFLAILMLYAAFGATCAMECWLNRRNYSFRQRRHRAMAIATGIALLSSALGALLESGLCRMAAQFNL